MLHHVVGRLLEDTTSDDLTSFMEESGLQGVRCTKLRPPSGRTLGRQHFLFHALQKAMNIYFTMMMSGLKVWNYVIGILNRSPAQK